eukprot:TRINITY_DN24031_c0_g1_i1.p1 TRINITY_DN24031_c0_g1~~TRINITY_DN24031_c0_g1_i1.p1  ORF type:complete len:1050 (+),score=168.40 TRINITY_DN24031_c0_g1_i1:358-3150(+)
METQVSECAHPGWGTVPSSCTHKEDLGIRCLACDAETCQRYRPPIRFGGALKSADQIAEAMYSVDSPSMRIVCSHSIPNDPLINCDVQSYKSSPTDFCHGGRTYSLESLLLPFDEQSSRAFVYGKELLQEYADKQELVRRHLVANPEDASLLSCLLEQGALSWNKAGIHAKPLRDALALNNSALGLIKKLYLAPRMHIMMDLDSRHSKDASAIDDTNVKKLAQTFLNDGVVEIDDFGLDIAALNKTIDAAFEDVDPAVTSSISSSMTTRVKLDALQPLIHNSTINAVVKAFLGPDATLDGYKVVRLRGNTSESEFIAGHWHNDRAGNRVKLFVRLHDVSPDPKDGGHPTLVARGSHDLMPFSIEEYTHSRLTDEFVRSEYPVAYLGGKMGGGFLFDTNALHRGFPSGRLSRTTIVLEYHSSSKCPIIQNLKLPIPCPSGDQHLVDASETKSNRTEPDRQTEEVCEAGGAGSACSKPRTNVMTAASSYSEDGCVQFVPADVLDTATLLQMPPELQKTGAAWGIDVKTNQFMVVDIASVPREVLIATVAEGCSTRWRHYGFDIMPFDGKTFWYSPESLQTRRALCVTSTGQTGAAPFSGQNAGGCVSSQGLVEFGEFSMLLAWRETTSHEAISSKAADSQQHAELANAFSEVLGYMSAADKQMLETVTGNSVDVLVQQIFAMGDAELKQVLSPVRFFPHDLNEQGLHPFRCLLAERSADARRARIRHSLPELEEQWVRDGFLRLDYDKYISTQGSGNDLLEELLQMVSGLSRPAVEPFRFVPRSVKHIVGDAQYDLHVDTFSQVVKLWVYSSNVTAEDGVLHFVKGSHRNSLAKLRWLYNRTRENSEDVVQEPSIRFAAGTSLPSEAELQAAGFPAALPVLPIPGIERTLIVADTSGLHARGRAPPGTVRSALRPMGAENDGGVRRVNPFLG